LSLQRAAPGPPGKHGVKAIVMALKETCRAPECQQKAEAASSASLSTSVFDAPKTLQVPRGGILTLTANAMGHVGQKKDRHAIAKR
jgi:hypothetical protein